MRAQNKIEKKDVAMSATERIFFNIMKNRFWFEAVKDCRTRNSDSRFVDRDVPGPAAGGSEENAESQVALLQSQEMKDRTCSSNTLRFA